MPRSSPSKCTLGFHLNIGSSKIVLGTSGASNNHLSSHRPSLSTHKTQSKVTQWCKGEVNGLKLNMHNYMNLYA